ncbi:MAG: hypothetical protein CL908_26630 [Deltaproteobacteria bacterium]|nr:hypothetical protein [Deltaproteobacteria bacterium]
MSKEPVSLDMTIDHSLRAPLELIQAAQNRFTQGLAAELDTGEPLPPPRLPDYSHPDIPDAGE